MHEWTQELDTYLRIIVTLEGRGRNPPSTCKENNCSERPLFRCLDCHNGGMVCSDCMVHSHQRSPFHRIEVRGARSTSNQVY